jgi:hypothetical protein
MPGELPRRTSGVVPARPAVVLLHRPLLAELHLGPDEALCHQAAERHDLLLCWFPADVSTMPG